MVSGEGGGVGIPQDRLLLVPTTMVIQVYDRRWLLKQFSYKIFISVFSSNPF
jgi:hypothetical protein